MVWHNAFPEEGTPILVRWLSKKLTTMSHDHHHKTIPWTHAFTYSEISVQGRELFFSKQAVVHNKVLDQASSKETTPRDSYDILRNKEMDMKYLDKLRHRYSYENTDVLIKAELLARGVKFGENSLLEIGRKYKEQNYGYNNPNWICNSRDIILPSELMINGMIVSVRYRRSSPYTVKKLEDLYYLYYENDERLAQVEFPHRPQFWSEYTSDGILMKRIGSVYGLTALTFNVMNECEFWQSGGNYCKFCNIGPTHKKFGMVEKVKTTNQICDVINCAGKTMHIDFVNFLGGSKYDHNEEFRTYIDLVRNLTDRLGIERMKGFVITMPPEDFKLIDLLFSAGITGIKFNLEVYNEHLFRQVCPGKAMYGYSRIIDALKYAVDVFGAGNVYTNLVVGLDKKSDLVQGFKTLTSDGILPVISSFHPDMDTPLYNAKSFDVAELLELSVLLAHLYKEYGYTPYLNKKCLRGDLTWEIYEEAGTVREGVKSDCLAEVTQLSR